MFLSRWSFYKHIKTSYIHSNYWTYLIQIPNPKTKPHNNTLHKKMALMNILSPLGMCLGKCNHLGTLIHI